MRRRFILAFAISVAVAVSLGAPPQPVVAAAQVVTKAAPGEFVWHDLVTENPAASRTFYSALFGWTFQAGDGIDPGYTIIKQGDVAIGGIVSHKRTADDTGEAQWLSYVVVADVDRVASAFKDGGGRVFRGPMNARKDLRVAAVADPQGAPIGLTNRGPHFDTKSAQGLHEWLWMEYVAREPAPALKFYADVIGFRYAISEQRERFTYYLFSTDRPRAGLFESIWKRDTSTWLPYVRVADPAAMAARVAALGGTVVLAPQPRVRNSSLAIVLDPGGAAIALQKYPFEKGVSP